MPVLEPDTRRKAVYKIENPRTGRIESFELDAGLSDEDLGAFASTVDWGSIPEPEGQGPKVEGRRAGTERQVGYGVQGMGKPGQFPPGVGSVRGTGASFGSQDMGKRVGPGGASGSGLIGDAVARTIAAAGIGAGAAAGTGVGDSRPRRAGKPGSKAGPALAEQFLGARPATVDPRPRRRPRTLAEQLAEPEIRRQEMEAAKAAEADLARPFMGAAPAIGAGPSGAAGGTIASLPELAGRVAAGEQVGPGRDTWRLEQWILDNSPSLSKKERDRLRSAALDAPEVSYVAESALRLSGVPKAVKEELRKLGRSAGRQFAESGAVESVDDPKRLGSTITEISGSAAQKLGLPAVLGEVASFFAAQPFYGIQAGTKAMEGDWGGAGLDVLQTALPDVPVAAVLKKTGQIMERLGARADRALVQAMKESHLSLDQMAKMREEIGRPAQGPKPTPEPAKGVPITRRRRQAESGTLPEKTEAAPRAEAKAEPNKPFDYAPQPPKPLVEMGGDELDAYRETVRKWEKEGHGNPKVVLGEERYLEWKALDDESTQKAIDFLTPAERRVIYGIDAPEDAAVHSLEDVDDFIRRTNGIATAETPRELGFWLRNHAHSIEKDQDRILVADRIIKERGWDPQEVIDAAIEAHGKANDPRVTAELYADLLKGRKPKAEPSAEALALPERASTPVELEEGTPLAKQVREAEKAHPGVEIWPKLEDGTYWNGERRIPAEGIEKELAAAIQDGRKVALAESTRGGRRTAVKEAPVQASAPPKESRPRRMRAEETPPSETELSGKNRGRQVVWRGQAHSFASDAEAAAYDGILADSRKETKSIEREIAQVEQRGAAGGDLAKGERVRFENDRGATVAGTYDRPGPYGKGHVVLDGEGREFHVYDLERIGKADPEMLRDLEGQLAAAKRSRTESLDRFFEEKSKRDRGETREQRIAAGIEQDLDEAFRSAVERDHSGEAREFFADPMAPRKSTFEEAVGDLGAVEYAGRAATGRRSVRSGHAQAGPMEGVVALAADAVKEILRPIGRAARRPLEWVDLLATKAVGDSFARLRRAGEAGKRIAEDLNKVVTDAEALAGNLSARLKATIQANYGPLLPNTFSREWRTAAKELAGKIESGNRAAMTKGERAVWQTWTEINRTLTELGAEAGVRVRRVVGFSTPKSLESEAATFFDAEVGRMRAGQVSKVVTDADGKNVIGLTMESEGRTFNLPEGQRIFTRQLVPPEEFFPRMIRDEVWDALENPESPLFQEAVEHLVKTGQARDKAMAKAALEDVYGAMDVPTGGPARLERPRLGVELPSHFYERNAARVMESHIRQSALRVALARKWGAQSEGLSSLLQRTGRQAKMAAEAVESAVGARPVDKLSRTANVVSSTWGSLTALTKLTGGTTALAQLGSFISTYGVLGMKNTLEAGATLFSRRGLRMLKEIRLSGVVGQEDFKYIQGYADAPGALSSVTDAALTLTGLKATDRALRFHAAAAGYFHAKDAVAKLARTADGTLKQNAAYRYLRDFALFSEEDVLRMLSTYEREGRVTLTPADRRLAFRAGVKTQVLTGPANLPEIAGTPFGRSLMRLQTFYYGQAKLFGFAAKEAVGHGNFSPLLRFAVGGALLYEPIREAKSAIIGWLEGDEGKATGDDAEKRQAALNSAVAAWDALKQGKSASEVKEAASDLLDRLYANAVLSGTMGAYGAPMEASALQREFPGWKTSGEILQQKFVPADFSPLFTSLTLAVQMSGSEDDFVENLQKAGAQLAYKEVPLFKRFWRRLHDGEAPERITPAGKE